jgi:ubiquitin carboxyl-terminal hydrolase 36/42
MNVETPKAHARGTHAHAMPTSKHILLLASIIIIAATTATIIILALTGSFSSHNPTLPSTHQPAPFPTHPDSGGSNSGGSNSGGSNSGGTASPSTKFAGLHNLGNTCYMDSILQALFLTDEWTNRLELLAIQVEEHHPMHTHARTAFTRDLQQVFRLLKENNPPGQAIYPTQFFQNHMFPKYKHVQQDAEEFLNFVLNQNDIAIIADDLFSGQTKKTKICLQDECPDRINENPRDDDWKMLSLGLGQQGTVSEIDFGMEVNLQVVPDFTCNQCNVKGTAAETSKVVKWPEQTLIVHLKRYEWSMSGQAHKINRLVNVKVRLTVTVPDSESESDDHGVEFVLFAVVVHYGSSPRGGHYVTFGRFAHEAILEAKNGTAADWHEFNDDRVINHGSFTDVQNIVKQNGYLLFYARLGVV